MLTFEIRDAKTKLGKLVEIAASGKVVVLTRRGKSVAEIHAAAECGGRKDTALAIRLLADTGRCRSMATCMSVSRVVLPAPTLYQFL